MLRIITSLIVLLGISISCGRHHNDKEYEKTHNLDISKINLDACLETYNEYVNKYPVLFQKALYGDKKALKEYSDLMLSIAKIENKINELSNAHELPYRQFKKYKELKSKLTP